jgi:hypothetical protein
LVKWIIVLVVGIAVILIGSAGRIPFTDISLALSEETRLKQLKNILLLFQGLKPFLE